MDAVQAANSGHPGMPMGMADIATVLWRDFLRHNPRDPAWADRDRFVLSNGHGSMLQYALLHLAGYDLSLDELRNFRQLHSKTPGHPEVGITPGVETTTGPLGQGLANAVGMALAEKLLALRFNKERHAPVDHYTYCFVGDGCLMEGISHEVCSLAGSLGLDKLIVFYDDNGISIDGECADWFSDDTVTRFEAYGWRVIRNVDGHSHAEIQAAIENAREGNGQPTLVQCRTVIGYGSPNRQGTAKAHGEALGDEEIRATRAELGWSHAPFEIPDEVYAAWDAREAGGKLQHQWDERLEAYRREHPEDAAELERRLRGELPENWAALVEDLVARGLAADKPVATRKASQAVLDALGPAMPELLGGSADLTPSNGTQWKGATAITPSEPDGRYVHYGVREFGMSAIMNGIALHGGLIPYSGTFLTFSDYCRGALRLSALMGIRVIHVMTHDSIGLGEDGPTHQPVEHLAALRAIPNLLVLRPADAMEAAECWEIMLESAKKPAVIALSRQGLPAVRPDYSKENMSARGAYTLWGEKDAEVVIFGTGSEAHLALEAAKELANEGISARAVSVPSMELFAAQSQDYKRTIFGKAKARVAVEAGIEQGWHKFLGENGRFVGMTGFGASGEISDLYTHFGITTKAVVDAAKEQL